ncbi:MAG TPA: hypothetical protein VGP77_15905 [Vicinamibacterales bacterium]|nr:hypothetical protein [Vicinamibacterales bacterium]
MNFELRVNVGGVQDCEVLRLAGLNRLAAGEISGVRASLQQERRRAAFQPMCAADLCAADTLIL